jgi:L-lactate utilization protein LutC
MDKVLKVLGEEDAPKFRGIYKDGLNREKPCYFLPRRECQLMAMSESYKIQAAVYDRLQELEAQQAPIIKAPTNYIEALQALIVAEQAKEEAIRTKAEIGSRREATAMNTASQAVKRVNALEVELDQSKQYATIKRMEMLNHGVKFKWQLLKATSIEMGLMPISVFDQNYGTVLAYHKDVWLETYAVIVE